MEILIQSHFTHTQTELTETLWCEQPELSNNISLSVFFFIIEFSLLPRAVTTIAVADLVHNSAHNRVSPSS